MKTTITIENGKISVQVDDQQAVVVQPAPVAPVDNHIHDVVKKVKKTAATDKLPKLDVKKDLVECGYCRRRGSLCVRHGGSLPRIFEPAAASGAKPLIPAPEKAKEQQEPWKPKVTLPTTTIPNTAEVNF